MPDKPKTFLDDAEIEQLLLAARQGDAAALGNLLDCFRSQLRIAARHTLNRRMAARIDESDLVQQTCLSAVRAFPDFRGEDLPQFMAWLQAVHRRNVLEVVREHLGTDKRSVADEVAEVGREMEAIRFSTPSQRLILGERADTVRRAVLQLPLGQREAIELRYLEELPLTEIAQQMGRTEQSVAGLLKRGLIALRQLLREIEKSGH